MGAAETVERAPTPAEEEKGRGAMAEDGTADAEAAAATKDGEGQKLDSKEEEEKGRGAMAEDGTADAAAAEDGKGQKLDSKEEAKTRKPVPLRKLLSLASPGELLVLSAGILGAMVNGAGTPAGVFMLGRMIDALGTTDMSEQVSTILVIAAVVVPAAGVQATCLRWFSQAQAAKMGTLYYESMLFKDISWFDLQTVASLPTNLVDDTRKVAEALGDKLGNLVCATTAFFLLAAVGFTVGPKLAAVSFAFVPMVAIGAGIAGQAIEGVANETQTWYAQAAASVEECLFALRTVVALGGERGEIQRYEKAVLKARAGGVRQAYITAFGCGWMESWWSMGTAAALYYGMTLAYNGEINVVTNKVYTGGDIVVVFFCVLFSAAFLAQTDPGVKAMSAGRIAAARFFEVVDTPAAIQRQAEDTRRSVSSFQSLELREVHFSYPARPTVSVLNGLSLKVLQGQKVAIVGASGSGKSTVMSLMERFYDPTRGSVLLNGENLQEFAPASVRALIGYVGQEPVLFAASIEENIMWGWPSASKEDLKEAMEAAQLDFVNSLPQRGASWVGVGGCQFSGGQKQRIALARAFLRKPKLLFLDEAASALDSANERIIQETIASISKSGIAGHSVTSVAIAHRLGTVQDSDVIFALKGGVVVEQGSHNELMEAKGIYYALAAAQGLNGLSVAGDTKGPGHASEGVTESPAEVESPGSGTPAADDADVCTERNEGSEERRKKIAKAYKVPYSQLLRYNKPELPLLVPGVLGAALHGASTPMQAYLIVGVLDAFLKSREEMRDRVGELAIYFVIMAIILFVAVAMHVVAFGIMSEALTQRLRVAVLTNVLRQEVGFHDHPAHTPGLIGIALQSWTYRVRTLLAGLEAQCNVVVTVALALLFAFMGSWQMTLVSLAAGPILAGVFALQSKFMNNAMDGGHRRMMVVQQLVSDTVQSPRTVQASGMERACVKHYSLRIAQACAGPKEQLIAGLAFAASQAVPALYQAFAFWFADWLQRNGHADFKGVMLAFFGTLYATLGAGTAGGLVGDASKAKVACHDMFKILNRKSMIDGLEPSGQEPAWAGQSESHVEAGRIEFKNVKFYYPSRKEIMVLKGVDFKLEPGQSIGLVGPSGGGKSTIMALIQRFYDPTEGSISIGAARTPLSSINIRYWRKQVGFVGQEPILFNTTVRANVLYGLDADVGETISEEQLEECRRIANLDFLDSASGQGWDMEVGPRGGRLSGGQKQRVAICRALVRQPAVLLLDEATSALDTENERVVQQALERARRGRTSIAIAHRLSTIRGCDLILVAADGVIVESGSHEELMAKEGVYFKLQASSKDEAA